MKSRSRMKMGKIFICLDFYVQDLGEELRERERGWKEERKEREKIEMKGRIERIKFIFQIFLVMFNLFKVGSAIFLEKNSKFKGILGFENYLGIF